MNFWRVFISVMGGLWGAMAIYEAITTGRVDNHTSEMVAIHVCAVAVMAQIT